MAHHSRNPFHVHDYRRWFGGTTLLSLSTATGIAVNLLLIDLTGSALIAGTVAAIVTLADLGGSILGGGLADQQSRRRILRRTMLTAAALNLLLVAVLLLPLGLPAALVLSVCILCLVGGDFLVNLAMPSLDGSLKAVIRQDAYTRAISASQARDSVFSVVGTPVTGLLYALHHTCPFLLRLLCQSSFVWVLSSIRTELGPAQQNAPHDDSRRPLPALGRALQSYRAAFRFIGSVPALTRFVIAAPLVNVMASLFAVWALFALRAEGHSATVIGVTLSGFALGSVLGSAATPFAADRVPTGWLAVVGLSAMTAMFAVLTLLPHTPLAIFLLGMCAMLPSPPLNAAIFSYVFACTDLSMQGRVIAVFKGIGGLAVALAPLLAGFAVSLDVSRLVLSLSCVLAATGVLILVTSSHVRAL